MDVLSCSYDLRFSIFPFSCGSPRSQPGYFRSHVFLDFGSQYPLRFYSILFSLLSTTFPTVPCCSVCIFLFLSFSCCHCFSHHCHFLYHVQRRDTYTDRIETWQVCEKRRIGFAFLCWRAWVFYRIWAFELFLTYLIASHERIFFFFSMCSVCSFNFCVHAVIQLSACLLSYFGPLYMANDRS